MATVPEQTEQWTSVVITRVAHETLVIDARKIQDLQNVHFQITDTFHLALMSLSLDFQVKNKVQTADQPTYQSISDPVIRFLQTDQ